MMFASRSLQKLQSSQANSEKPVPQSLFWKWKMGQLNTVECLLLILVSLDLDSTSSSIKQFMEESKTMFRKWIKSQQLPKWVLQSVYKFLKYKAELQVQAHM